MSGVWWVGWDAFVREAGEVIIKNAIVLPDPQPKIKALLGVSTYINVAPNYLGLISRGGAPSTETHFPDPPPPSHKGRGGTKQNARYADARYADATRRF